MAGGEDRSAAPNPVVDFWILQIIFITVVVRIVAYSLSTREYPLLTFALLTLFLILALTQYFAGIDSRRAIQIYVAIQSLIVFTLLMVPPYHDYFAILYIGLALPVTRYLPARLDILWLAVLCALAFVALLLGFGPSEGIAYFAAYLAGILFIGLYGRANRNAERARAKSEELRRELEAANARLREYASHVEEAATAQERSRLSRELHDAVTQTIFSMSLTAEAARSSLERHPERVGALLERLQEMARDALSETRSMVEQLRPRSVAEVGLVDSLRRYASLQRRRCALEVELKVRGEERGPAALKDALFRTAQEALNNVVRHAGVGAASVELSFGEADVTLVVSDAGKGFDTAEAQSDRCFGLHTMSERAQSLGGRLDVSSAPGRGTRVEVRIPFGGEAV